MLWKIARTIFMLPILGFIAIVASSCTQLGLNYASLEVDNKIGGLPALEVRSKADWQTSEAPELRSLLEESWARVNTRCSFTLRSLRRKIRSGRAR